MSGARHTPGPHRVCENAGGGLTIAVAVAVTGGEALVPLGFTHAVRNPAILRGRAPIEADEAQANARLWAAAPELLESVSDLISLIHSVCPEYDEGTMCANARAAVAKATGEQP